MSRRGPKPDYLTLVDAADAIEDAADGLCGAPTSKGTPCGRRAGWGTDHTGNGRCRDHVDVPRTSSCPLPLTDLQARIWENLVGHLRRLQLMKEVFWPAVYGLTIALSRLHQSDSAIDQPVVKGDNGAWKKHPATTISNQMLSQVRSYCNDLGLNPSAIAKIGFEPQKKQSTLDRLISGD